jgi:hypothetical protein
MKPKHPAGPPMTLGNMRSHSHMGRLGKRAILNRRNPSRERSVFKTRSACAARMNATSPPPTETDRRAEAARLAQRHNEALAKKPADNPRFKPAANVPGQGFVIVGTKR